MTAPTYRVGFVRYSDPTPARRRPRRPANRVTTVKVPAAVMATALRLAGGDRARLALQADGSVLVLNHPRH